VAPGLTSDPATMQKGTLGPARLADDNATDQTRRPTNWLDPAKVPADWRHFFHEHRLAQDLLEMVSLPLLSFPSA